jgi:hypothetical protein
MAFACLQSFGTLISFDTTDTNSERPQKQKKFWSYIKNMKKDHTGVAPLRNNGLLINDSKQKAEVLNIQYHSIRGWHLPASNLLVLRPLGRIY